MWKLYNYKLSTLKLGFFEKKLNVYFTNCFSNLYNNHSTNISFFINNNTKLLSKSIKTVPYSNSNVLKSFIIASLFLAMIDTFLF